MAESVRLYYLGGLTPPDSKREVWVNVQDTWLLVPPVGEYLSVSPFQAKEIKAKNNIDRIIFSTDKPRPVAPPKEAELTEDELLAKLDKIQSKKRSSKSADKKVEVE